MGRRLAGIRLAARIARRNARRTKGRTVLVGIMVALPVLAAVVLDVLIRSTYPTDATFLRDSLGERAEARLVLVCDGGEAVQGFRDDAVGCDYGEGEADGRTDVAAEVSRAVPGATLVRLRGRALTVEREGRSNLTFALTEGDLGRLPGAFPLLDGRLPEQPDEVALSRWAAERARVEVGETLTLDDGTTRTVTGILAPRSRTAEALGFAAAPAEPVDQWFVLDRPVTWPEVEELNALGIAVTSRAVLTDPPPRSEVRYYAEGWSGTVLDGGGAAVGAVAMGVGLLEAVLLIGPAFAVGARRATRGLALVAANGGERRDLRRVVLWNGVVVAGAASVAAAVLGVTGAALAVTALVPRGHFANLVLPWLDVAGFVLLGTLLGVAAAWFPARQAARLDVVAALAGRRSEARVRRRVPVLGVLLLGAGVAIALVGAGRGLTVLAVAGALLMMIGVVAASGALVTLLGRLAARAPVATRLAVRDAARQRSRTAPAVAAVIAAVAGAVAGGAYLTAQAQHTRDLYTPIAAEGTVYLAFDVPDGAAEQAAVIERGVAAADRAAALAAWAPVRMTTGPGGPLDHDLWIEARIPPERRCPLWDRVDVSAEEMRQAEAEDPRCAMGRSSSATVVWPYEGYSGDVVDDGSALALTGLPGAEDAAAALAAGEVVVADPDAVWPDGTVHLAVHTSTGADGEPAEPVELVLPGHATGWSDHFWRVVLPEAAVGQLADLGVATRTVGAIAQPVAPFDASAEEEVRDAVTVAHDGSILAVERMPTVETDVATLATVGAAAFVGLWATWLAVGLALAESRADLATLAAVGAGPGTRRRVAAAQAGVISVTGVVVGVLAGLLLAVVFVRVQGQAALAGTGVPWRLTIPWPFLGALVVGLPLVAGLAAAATARAPVTISRRVAT